MAEVETKQAVPEALAEKPSVETSTASTESVAEEANSNQKLVEEEKKSAEKTDEKSEVTEASQGTSEDTTKNGSGSTEPSKRVQDGRAWNNRDRERDFGRGRGRGRGGGGGRSRGNNYNRDKSYKHNIKSDMTSQKESSDPVEIRKQVEFYFSDSNLLQDRFLFERIGGHSNNPVPISLVHSFSRMRRYQPFSAVVAALKDSSTLDIVDEDSCIKRKIPLSEEVKDKPMVDIRKVHENNVMAKTVYAKGFGEEGPSTQFDLEAYFADFGPTSAVRLRRTDEKIFKGSVYVEFDTVETAKQFLASDPKPSWKGKELLIMSKKQYCDGKVDDIREGRIRPHENVTRYDNKPHRKPDGDDWKARRAEDQANGFDEEPDRNDRRGGHRGFGSSGQRGRGGRGRGRDRNGDRNHHRREERNEHNPKIPTIQSTTPSKTPKRETSNETTPSKPDTAAESTLPKPASSESTSTKANEPEASESKPDQVMADADPLKVNESELKAEKPAPPLPIEESKKRQREDDESAATEETKAKMQKIEENGAS